LQLRDRQSTNESSSRSTGQALSSCAFMASGLLLEVWAASDPATCSPGEIPQRLPLAHWLPSHDHFPIVTSTKNVGGTSSYGFPPLRASLRSLRLKCAVQEHFGRPPHLPQTSELGHQVLLTAGWPYWLLQNSISFRRHRISIDSQERLLFCCQLKNVRPSLLHIPRWRGRQ